MDEAGCEKEKTRVSCEVLSDEEGSTTRLERLGESLERRKLNAG
jgi:hypothetical protein